MNMNCRKNLKQGRPKEKKKPEPQEKKPKLILKLKQLWRMDKWNLVWPTEGKAKPNLNTKLTKKTKMKMHQPSQNTYQFVLLSLRITPLTTMCSAQSEVCVSSKPSLQMWLTVSPPAAGGWLLDWQKRCWVFLESPQNPSAELPLTSMERGMQTATRPNSHTC